MLLTRPLGDRYCSYLQSVALLIITEERLKKTTIVFPQKSCRSVVDTVTRVRMDSFFLHYVVNCGRIGLPYPDSFQWQTRALKSSHKCSYDLLVSVFPGSAVSPYDS